MPVDKRGPGSDVLIIGDATGVAIPFGSLFAHVLPVPGCLYALEVSDGRTARASLVDVLVKASSDTSDPT